MRVFFVCIFAILVFAMACCAHIARRSRKAIGKSVMQMLLGLIPPVIGNLILIASTDRTVSTVGFYIYFLGMDIVMMALWQFTEAYCGFTWSNSVRTAIYVILGLDAVQILANMYFNHAFAIEEIDAYGMPYFRLIPYWGQTIHRVVDYGILAVVIIIFVVKTIRSSRIAAERYYVILGTILLTTVWETLYIFSRAPVDRSMVGFGVFGLLVFYFSLYYRPLRLLDKMLAMLASGMPDAIYFFDGGGHCFWANNRGIELAQISGSDFEEAKNHLEGLLGNIDIEEDKTEQRIIGSGESIKSYVLERRTVFDEKERGIGSFLSVRDNTDDQKVLQREIYNATHDPLTQVYNRAGYDLLMSNLEIESTLMLLVDIDRFKQVNDHYGHEVGDKVLKKTVLTMKQFFRSEDCICRIGGDEFVVLMKYMYEHLLENVRKRLVEINHRLLETADGLPAVSVSAGIACGGKDVDLFNRADRALYDSKNNGRCCMTIYGQQPMSLIL